MEPPKRHADKETHRQARHPPALVSPTEITFWAVVSVAGWVLVAALVLVLTAHARADLDAGISAYDRGDYATALAEFRQAAEQGSVGIGVTGRPAMEPACVVC